MAAMASITVEEVEMITSKLLSDKSKLREDGIKQLMNHLNASETIGLASLLDHQTALYEITDKPLTSTWSGIVRAICQCNKLEIISSKKRAPKAIFAKVLRNIIQKAEERIHIGVPVFVPQDLRIIFSHLLEALSESPGFVADYSHIIRQLAVIPDYCTQISKPVYARLVGFFMDRIKVLMLEKMSEVASYKEDALRAISTLYCLLKHSPEDFLVKVREVLIEGFNDVFLHLRDEDRVARKLLSLLNLFLLKDGINLGDLLVDIHSNIKGFILRTWKVTRDRDLKDELVFYCRLQLKLRTVVTFTEGDFIVQMKPLVEKDLEQSCAVSFTTGAFRFEGGKEGKLCTVTKGVWCFLDFAASILIEAQNFMGSRFMISSKKQKKDDVFVMITEHLIKGNPLWWGSFCLLVRNHYQDISRAMLIEWLQSLSGHLERAFADASSTTAGFEALVWTLRCLQELAAILPCFSTSNDEEGPLSHMDMQCRSCWEIVWATVSHWVPLFSSTLIIVNESLKLLGYILVQNTLVLYAVPKEFWVLKPLTEQPTGAVLFFMASFFSSAAEQAIVHEDFELWKKLLNNVVSTTDKLEYAKLKSAAILALTVGYIPKSLQLSINQCSLSSTVSELEDWAKFEETSKEEENEFDGFNELASFTTHYDNEEMLKGPGPCDYKMVSLPIKQMFVKELANSIKRKAVFLTQQKKNATLEQLFTFASIIASCFNQISCALQRRGEVVGEWSSSGEVYQCLIEILNSCVSKIDESMHMLAVVDKKPPLADLQQNLSEVFSPHTKKKLRDLLSSDCFSSMLKTECSDNPVTVSFLTASLLRQMTRLVHTYSELLDSVSISESSSVKYSDTVLHPHNISDGAVGGSILDADFDDIKQSGVSNLISSEEDLEYKQSPNFKLQWKLSFLATIMAFVELFPEMTFDVLFDLLQTEEDPKIKKETLLCLCKCIRSNRSDKVMELVDCIGSQRKSDWCIEQRHFFILTAVDTLLATILSSQKHYTTYSLGDVETIKNDWNFPRKMILQLANLLQDASQKTFLFWWMRGILVKAIAKLFVLDPAATDGLLDTFLTYLHDVDYRVRYIMCRNVKILFHAYTGHEGLLRDICVNLGINILNPSDAAAISKGVSLTSKDRRMDETAVMTLGEVAACSEKVEVEAVFMVCATAADSAPLRSISRTILDRLARQLHYPNRWKYLSHLLSRILFYWIKVRLPLPTLVEIKDLLVCNSEPVDFLNYSASMMLPPLLLYDRDDELTWLSKVVSKPVSTLVKDSFVAIFSTLLPMYCHGSEKGRESAHSVLQGKMLTVANLSEDDRDILIRKHMVSIVNSLFQLCSVADSPQFPLYTKQAIISSVQTVVDGFCGRDDFTPEVDEHGGVKDALKIFRSDRVFMFILQIHLQLESSFSPRHKRDKLAGLECLIDVIQNNIKVPSTCRYLFHTVLESLGSAELLVECCNILNSILDILSDLPGEECSQALGPQLQFIVASLVSACVRISEGEGTMSSPVFAVLERVTIKADPSLYEYMKDLPPFPDVPIFKTMQDFLSNHYTSPNTYNFSKFVMQTQELPSFLRLKSLQNLHGVFCAMHSGVQKNSCQFQCDSDAVFGVLRSVLHCSCSSLHDFADVIGDIISMVAIGDPNAVVFDVPGLSDGSHSFSLRTGSHASVLDAETGSGVSDDVFKSILLWLKTYLSDEHALVIELAAQTLRGLLSTERGCRLLKNMNPKDAKYLSVFSRGPNEKVVENLLDIMKIDSTKKYIPLENDELWDVNSKSYDDWICSIVYSLMHYCNDPVLRLCQKVVHCKSFLAESFLPHVLISLATNNGKNRNICKLITSQVEKHVFSDKNQNPRSVQVFLDALNEVRRCYVLSQVRSGQNRGKSHIQSKVYWLDLDYLQTAGVAQKCGAYFTSALYIEHWCEEKFGQLSLGEPDFSDDNELPTHVELLLTIYSQINEPDGVYGVVRTHKLISQIKLHEHEGNWSRALEGYDLLLRNMDNVRGQKNVSVEVELNEKRQRVQSETGYSEWNYNKGLMRSLQRTGCDHILKVYCGGLCSEKGRLEKDIEFQEVQFESAWRTGDWDTYFFSPKVADVFHAGVQFPRVVHFHSNLYWCLRSLHQGDIELFSDRMKCAKQELVQFFSTTSLESTGNVYPTIIKLQIFNTLQKAWNLRWRTTMDNQTTRLQGPFIPSSEEESNADLNLNFESGSEGWQSLKLAILEDGRRQGLQHMHHQYDLFEPYVAFYTVMLKVLQCSSHVSQQLLDFATFARKAGRFNQAAAAVHDLKQHYKEDALKLNSCFSLAAKVEEAKILWARCQQGMAVSMLKYILNHHPLDEISGSVYCLTGKWLAQTRSDSAKVILKQYHQKAVQLFENAANNNVSEHLIERSRAFYRMAHFSDSLYKSYEERLNSSEWHAALRLRMHKSKEADILARRMKVEQKDATKKGSHGKVSAQLQDAKVDIARKLIELQRQLAMDNEEAQRLENDKVTFMMIALNSYRQCLITSNKYDLRVVFRITSLWFNLSGNQAVVKSMFDTINQVKSYKFLPLMYQIASRLGPAQESPEVLSFQYVLTSLVYKLATEHPYHSVNQLLALANGDRVKDKQKNRGVFVTDMEKKQAAEAILIALASDKKDLIEQMRQLVEIYIRLAEIEVKKEDMGKNLPLPRDIRSIRQLELVPVITAEVPISSDANYSAGQFPFYKGLSDRYLVMHGINAPKVVDCLGSDGHYYRQLAKSGDDDLRQDAVMEQLFGLVNLLLHNHPDTRSRRLHIRTYKVIPFTPSAGVLEWVDGTMPLGDYLLGSLYTPCYALLTWRGVL
ncbi:hypothetical protein KP509_04G060500 [Ceratopteris richardii]|uniref:Serine/threonine-protein kinase ATM n=1 Tax=Ceratopteris richardii TaxID=49495 RepID=A0A8T2UT84_CERRI|nr:hypothetical protein KP509_04G060500 [Ceratopteris richardii]